MNPSVTGWDQVKQLLRQAEKSLSANGCGKNGPPTTVSNGDANPTGRFEEFMQHNELELAWDELADRAVQVHAGPDCWNFLAEAAGLMKLPDKEAEAREHLQGSISARN